MCLSSLGRLVDSQMISTTEYLDSYPSLELLVHIPYRTKLDKSRILGAFLSQAFFLVSTHEGVDVSCFPKNFDNLC